MQCMLLSMDRFLDAMLVQCTHAVKMCMVAHWGCMVAHRGCMVAHWGCS